MRRLALALALSFLVAPPAIAADDLTATIAAQDAALFDAYNTCNLDKLAGYFTEDLEFYDDRNGLLPGRANLLEGVQKYICGKVRRVLVPESLEVHPLKGYGAVEIGTHRFEHPSDSANPPGEARFIMIWQLKDGSWKVTRVVSFEHGAAK